MAEKKKVGVPTKDSVLKKRYPEAGLASDILVPGEDTLWLPSRILPLNYLIGGGIQYGHILEDYGEESTGKTLMALDFVCAAQSLGGIAIWDDAEGTFSAHWAVAHGVDLNRLEIYPAQNIVEKASDWIADMVVKWRKKLTNNEPILVVVDSLAALETMENINVSQQDRKAEMGNRAKAIDTLLRSRNPLFHKLGICVFCVNQVRSKIGASKYEDPDTTPGGKAMRFYASIRLGLYRGSQIKDKYKEKIGQKVYVRVKKNKIAPPRERLETEVYFVKEGENFGYNRYKGLWQALVKDEVIKRKKAIFYYKGKVIARGDEKMELILATNDDLRAKLVRRSSINTISKTRAKLASLKSNLYPVIELKKKDEDE